MAAQGVCQCYVGYDGTSCSDCADGYQRVAGICQRTLTSFKVQAALAATAQANANQKVSITPRMAVTAWLREKGFDQ